MLELWTVAIVISKDTICNFYFESYCVGDNDIKERRYDSPLLRSLDFPQRSILSHIYLGKYLALNINVFAITSAVGAGL